MIALVEACSADRARLAAILPPELQETFEYPPAPLAGLVRELFGVVPHTAISSLARDAWYALFETGFLRFASRGSQAAGVRFLLGSRTYDPLAVLSSQLRAREFLQIIRSEGVNPIAVDINRTNVSPVPSEGFKVVKMI